MKLTLRHFYDFGARVTFPGNSLLSPTAWDALRSGVNPLQDQAFVLPATREQWLALCSSSTEAGIQARDIGAIICDRQYSSLVSIGVGRACLEYHLKKLLPSLPMTCTEFSPQVIERLRQVFTECDRVDFFDFTTPVWPNPPGHPLFLLNRVDTELSDRQWGAVFANMARCNVQEALLVATAFLTPRVLVSELKRRLLGRILGRRLTFAGYIRTKDQFAALWQPHYHVVREVSVGQLTGFLLARTPTIPSAPRAQPF